MDFDSLKKYLSKSDRPYLGMHTTTEKEGLVTSTTTTNRASRRSSTTRRISLEETKREEDFDDTIEEMGHAPKLKLKIKMKRIKKPQDLGSTGTIYSTTSASRHSTNAETTINAKKKIIVSKDQLK